MNREAVNEKKEFSLSCPIPIQDYPYVLLAHGGGGKLMHQLIDSEGIMKFTYIYIFRSQTGHFISAVSAFISHIRESYIFPAEGVIAAFQYRSRNEDWFPGVSPLILSKLPFH